MIESSGNTSNLSHAEIPYMAAKSKWAKIIGDMGRCRSLFLNASKVGMFSKKDIEAEYKESYSLKLGLINKLKIIGERCTDERDNSIIGRKKEMKTKGTQT